MATSCPLKFTGKCEILSSSSSEYDTEQFLKSAAFSPDGSSVLATSEGHCMNVYTMDLSAIASFKYYQADMSVDLSECKLDCLHFHSKIPVGESVYDSKWYPHMNQADDGTNCFITTARDHPISLWDTPTGLLRATYSGINHLDELDSAISLAFNLTGEKIYAGSNKMIR